MYRGIEKIFKKRVHRGGVGSYPDLSGVLSSI